MAGKTSCWRVVEDALGAGLRRPLLYGASGTGKIFEALTEGEPTMSRRLVCTEDLTSAEGLGTWTLNGPDRWGFHEGSAIQAWLGIGREGGRLVVDELDDKWLEDNVTMCAYVQSRDGFLVRFRLECDCIEKCAEKAIFDMVSFGKRQLDVEPTREVSL